MQRKAHVSRRDFVKTAAATVAATGAFPYFARGQAADRPLKIGIVGCGGRGTGAGHDAMNADPNVKVVALADVFKDRVEGCRKSLTDKGRTEIKNENCFVGFDAYQKLLQTDVDYVILATPPYYRPEHFEACVKAGKHVFTEKPVAVDPVGIRRFMAAGKLADEKGLSVVAGTQRRHQKGYIETINRIRDGAIGDIVAGRCYWNMGQLWYRPRQNGWDDMEWMIRDWVNWTWLSGDHVVEQHVHNTDVINWVLGRHVTKVVAMGARHRRVTGDQYDMFAADLYYPVDEKDKDGKIHVLSMCRQINGCANDVSEHVTGTKGFSNCNGWISTIGVLDVKGENPYVQEHKDLIAAIRADKPINEAQNVAESTLTNIMIRMSAYTGQAVTWDEAIKSDLDLEPPEFELSEENIKAGILKAHIRKPGRA
ncbi:MAG TPA: Gfo/Idh/MocA family oxidoreductase [Phycisphaerae bacterium]|jgi:myo-inositol 2-dehydrogenase/D-chiro-inositol 1-dehydrogenase|nr:Gfo/Idh/MocA family oxidoreductase [Phycisphaerae bacterium]HOB74626.1 Gfo/Idh/MocA family oxidoreductase [Phycisphaerae bacterium]HOJ53581.1 Gfo/Idh/MocA family oxidoreductase [Phycisphaerae bacterium]HOL25262.1 Gfo/Idh/MocA family oxidoreductase [Phycisphaerae bacterium]HPP20523.1 Gfo/Idh/MocA family oxidoreductase [Phycisphaerae bacterium]